MLARFEDCKSSSFFFFLIFFWSGRRIAMRRGPATRPTVHRITPAPPGRLKEQTIATAVTAGRRPSITRHFRAQLQGPTILS